MGWLEGYRLVGLWARVSCLGGWLVGWLLGVAVGWLGGLVGRPAVLKDWFVFVGWLVGWLDGLFGLAGREGRLGLVGWWFVSVCRWVVVGLGWFAGCRVGLGVGLIGGLIGGLVGGLIGGLVGGWLEG